MQTSPIGVVTICVWIVTSHSTPLFCFYTNRARCCRPYFVDRLPWAVIRLSFRRYGYVCCMFGVVAPRCADGCGMCCRGQHCCVASSHPMRVGSLVDHHTLMFNVCCMKLSSLPGICYRSLLTLPCALSRPVRCGHHRWRTRWLCGCHQSGSTRHEGTTLSASHLVRQCLPISTNRMNNLASGLLTLGRSPVLRSEERLVARA